MKTTMKLGLFALVAVLTGCVTGTRNIELVVPEYSDANKASGSVYIARINDKRTFEDKPRDPSTPSVTGDLAKTSEDQRASLIGRQRNGYGKAMGDVALQEGRKVNDQMYDLLKEGLESRGYTLTDDENAAVDLEVDIEKFWAWFSPGMWAVSFESQIEATVGYEAGQRQGEFSVEGYGINKGQVASDANWALAYRRAFEDFLKNLDAALDNNGL